MRMRAVGSGQQTVGSEPRDCGRGLAGISGAGASTGAGRMLAAWGVVSAAGNGAGGTMVALWWHVREQSRTALGTGIAVPAAPIRSTVREEWTSEYHPRPVHVRASAGLVLRPRPSGHGDVDRMYSFMY